MKIRIFSIFVLLIAFCVFSYAQSGLKVTEIMYDVPASSSVDPMKGDVNGDGSRSPRGDEFVEFFNSSNANIDLSAHQLIERQGVPIFTFPAGAILAPGKYAVVFGAADGAAQAFPAGTSLFSAKTGNPDAGFDNGAGKSNFANNSDRCMIVNPVLKDTLIEIWWYDPASTNVTTPFTKKAVSLTNPNNMFSTTKLTAAIGQSVAVDPATGKWGLHTEVSGNASKLYSLGAPANTSTSVEDEGIMPNSFQLHQNYPNPFNPTTVISFEVSKEQNVTLKVYNLLGEEIATLLNRKVGAGIYFVNFDAKDLSAGIYLYSLKTENFKEAKKMVLLK